MNKISKFTKINDPLGYSIKAQHINDDLSGYDSDGQPRNGSWIVCTVDDSPIFTITKRDLLDFAVDYYQDGYYSSAIPTAGTYLQYMATSCVTVFCNDMLCKQKVLSTAFHNKYSCNMYVHNKI